MIPAPNYTQTPNVLFDELMRGMNESELKVFLAIIRKTFGWKKDRDRISLSQIMELTGLSKPSVITGIKGLVGKELINFYQSQSGNEFEVRVDGPQLVKQVDQGGKATLPEAVKQLDTQKKLSKETIQKKDPLPLFPTKEPTDEILAYLNDKAEKRYKTNPTRQKTIGARFKEGYTMADFKTVIDNKVSTWKDDPKMNAFLTPETLFAASHFDNYLNQGLGTTSTPLFPEQKGPSEMSEMDKRMYELAGRR